MENTVFLLEVGDRWLSTDSLSNVAICTNMEETISLAKQDAQKYDDELSDEEIEQLLNYCQTQGRDNNYIISLIQLDKLI